MVYKSSKTTSYKIRSMGKYNNLITVPKWVAATLGVGEEVYWTLKNNEVVLTKEKPVVFETPKKVENDGKWKLALNKDNPSIYNDSERIIYGYSKEKEKYFVGRFGETPIYGDKEFISRSLDNMSKIPIEKETEGNFDAFCALTF